MCRSKAEGGRRCKPSMGRRSATTLISTADSVPLTWVSQMRRSRTVILRDAQNQLGEYLDAVVNAAPVDSPMTLASAGDADVADQVAEAITTTLQDSGYPRGKWQSHLLCGALAAVAQAMKAGEDAARTVITKGVTMALISSGVPRMAARLAARAAVDTLMRLAPIRHWEDMRRAVQLLAVSLCPDVADHPEVEQYCLRPLASEHLSDAIRQELAELEGDGSAEAG